MLQPFARRSNSTEGNGLGLGLAIADGFVRAMGKEFRIEETPGGGTTAIVSLK